MLSDTVFERGGAHGHTMSKNLYAFLVSAFVFVGIGVSLAASLVSHDWKVDGFTDMLLIIGIPLVAAIGGTMLSVSSDNPLVSAFGYAVVAVAFGVMLGPVLAEYTAASIVKVLAMTTAIVAVFSVVGAMIPDNLEGFGSYVLGGLLILLLRYFFVPLAHLFGVEAATALTVLDIVGIVLFCGIIVFDWNRAMHLSRNLDNAVDSALAVYLDWFNIFVRLLALTGQSSSNN